MTLVISLVVILKHLRTLSLASPYLPVDFLLVENLQYALRAIFTILFGQSATAITYEAEAAFNQGSKDLAP